MGNLSKLVAARLIFIMQCPFESNKLLLSNATADNSLFQNPFSVKTLMSTLIPIPYIKYMSFCNRVDMQQKYMFTENIIMAFPETIVL